MIVYESSDINALKLKDTAIALGEFDAIHIGHTEIIRKTVSAARSRGLKSVVFMFENNPSELIFGKNIKSVNTLKMRYRFIESLGADVIISMKFDEKFAYITRDKFFFDYIKDKFGAKYLTVGYNYTFGKKGMGDIAYLNTVCAENNIDLEVVPEVTTDGETVSSTRVRELVSEGCVDIAAKLLGREFSLEGVVVKGDGIGGKLIGFPTANIRISDGYAIPKLGVYISRVRLDDKIYPSVTNVGGKPTIRDGCMAVETHIIDTDFPPLYGIETEVMFCKFIRDIVAFDSIDELKAQLEKDKAEAKRYFASFNGA